MSIFVNVTVGDAVSVPREASGLPYRIFAARLALVWFSATACGVAALTCCLSLATPGPGINGNRVQCANLVYAVNKSSRSFSDRFFKRLEMEMKIQTDSRFSRVRLDDAKATPELEQSLVSLSAGAFVVKKPGEYSQAYSVLELLDERASTNWSAPRGVVTPQTIVIELPEKSVLKSVEFDCAEGVSYAGSCAQDMSVEMSDTNAESGFQKIADVSIKEGSDKQRFPVSAEVPGRWVRLTVKNNHGSKDFIQLNDFRAYGTQLSQTPFPDVSGTYTSDLGDVHLKQEGTSVTGCYFILAPEFLKAALREG